MSCWRQIRNLTGMPDLTGICRFRLHSYILLGACSYLWVSDDLAHSFWPNLRVCLVTDFAHSIIRTCLSRLNCSLSDFRHLIVSDWIFEFVWRPTLPLQLFARVSRLNFQWVRLCVASSRGQTLCRLQCIFYRVLAGYLLAGYLLCGYPAYIQVEYWIHCHCLYRMNRVQLGRWDREAVMASCNMPESAYYI